MVACRAGDHPRSRGVYVPFSEVNKYNYGSSPLARGLLAAAHERGFNVGIIPARAGFTDFEAFLNDSRVDHPRSRGVYGLARFWVAL